MCKMYSKLGEIFSNGEGIGGWVVLTILSFITGYEMMLCLLLLVTIMDAIWGVAVSVKQGQFVLSDLLRRTIVKLLSYLSIFLVLMCVEKILSINGIATAVVVSGIALTELWSTCGNILIIYPNLAFLRLMRPVLKGEIARKLNISEEQVEKALNVKPKRKKHDTTEQSDRDSDKR